MLLSEVVAISDQIAARRDRLGKMELLAQLLRQLAPAEVPAAVSWLSGPLRQGRIGLGWNALRPALEASAQSREANHPPTLFEDAVSDSSPGAPLTVLEVDRAFEEAARLAGKGSASHRAQALARVFRRATHGERDFLARLVMGELRQGALAGVLEEALARATGIELREL